MKPVVPLLLLAALCACARPAADPANDAGAQASTADTPSTVTDTPSTAQAPVMTSNNETDPSGTPPPADAASAAPVRGIAVGEPHPSGDARVDAGPARYDGYGDLRFGMTAAQARAAWKGDGLQGDAVEPDNCAYLRPAGTAAGPYLMFEGGRFVRYDMQGANAVAPGGGRVGMSGDDIRRLYAGRVAESPHHYVEGGKYLRVTDPAAKSRALVFEVDAAGRVTTWRAGQAPQVDYIEGCS